MSVIPDAIEPVEGWRAWHVDDDGRLMSMNGTYWLPGQELAAQCCASVRSEMRWQLVSWREDPEPSSSEETTVRTDLMGQTGPAVAYSTNLFAMSAITMTQASVAPRPAPVIEPPPGFRWEDRLYVYPKHEAPHMHCSCGVYIASDRHTAEMYGGRILGKTKGWGRVIQHTNGWRAQFAYPSELYVPEGFEVADYGVPITTVPASTLPASVVKKVSRIPLYISGAGIAMCSGFILAHQWL